MASAGPTFQIVVGLEHYLIECTQPVKVQGEPVAFGEPAYIEVGGAKYWAHFDPDAYLPDELEDEATPEQLADAVERAVQKPVAVRLVGFGRPAQCVLTEDGFDFEQEPDEPAVAGLVGSDDSAITDTEQDDTLESTGALCATCGGTGFVEDIGGEPDERLTRPCPVCG